MTAPLPEQSLMEQLLEIYTIDELLQCIPTEQHEQARYDWSLWARPKQQAPAWAWFVWLLMCGRGFGKTRVGAEWTREQTKTSQYVNLIGATADDARDIMIDGESGILAICPPRERPVYRKSDRQLAWPNGAKSLIFTADEPDRLRGKQHEKVWADEIASWRYPESWDQMIFGLRLGPLPQVCATTTPRPIKFIRELMHDRTTHVTRGSMYENKANLAASFLREVEKKYGGTRLGRQEIEAELLDDVPGALWKRDNIDAHRARVLDADGKLHLPECERIVVAIDPATTSDEDSAETGIIVAGRLGDHFYVLEDLSMRGTPDEWARRAVEAYKHWKADRIVAEVNNGGDMIEALLRTVDKSVSYRKVHASRGKVSRAEPIAALYEQGRGHHVGSFPQLEDQMCVFVPGGKFEVSPDRADALVWAATDLMLDGQDIPEYVPSSGPERRE